jgi:hypothetical protein
MRYKMKFNINELTVGEVKEIAALFNGYSQREVINEESVYGIGETWFIRTVTHHLVGEVKRVTDKEIILKGGTVLWVADDGRFTEAIKTGKFSETEVYGEQDVVIGRGSVIDGTRLKVNIEIAQR